MSTYKPILMDESYWANSQLSVARLYGQVRLNGVEYIIVNKEGKDIYECSVEAERAGRQKAIEPGEPADLIDKRYIKLYKKMGREKFLQMLKEFQVSSPQEAEKIYKEHFK